MFVHGIIDRTQVNGPGSRVGVWTSGCTLGCPGCWNPETHKHGQGTLWNDYELAKHILAQPNVNGVTFSGGDPIQQADCLLRVVDHIHIRRPGFSVGLYTGYTLGELEEGAYDTWTNTLVGKISSNMWPASSTWWPELKKHLDFAIMGRFNQGKVSINLPLRGSSNQDLVLFNDRYTAADFGPQMVEITIAPGGKSAVLTGFPVGMSIS
jgi:anaerobic ribonucleoside-triphosphate reductase activating protein